MSQEVRIFLTPFFFNCRQWFLQEFRDFRPGIVISFGKPVHQLLIEQFSWDVPSEMKDVFGSVYGVSVLGNNVYYAPCIHINSKGKPHYRNLWNTFIQRLKETVISAHIT